MLAVAVTIPYNNNRNGNGIQECIIIWAKNPYL